MNYREAVRLVLSNRTKAGLADISLNVLLLARAVDRVAPGRLGAAGIDFSFDGKRLMGAHEALVTATGAPGVLFRQLLETAGLKFTLPLASLPAVFLGDFNVASISRYIGVENLSVINALKNIFRDRVAPMGLLPTDKILEVLDCGVVAFVASPSYLKSNFPGTSQAMLEPAGAGEAWPLILKEFKAPVDAWLARNVQLAANAVFVSAANADAWAKIESIVKAVSIQELPTNVLRWTGSGLWSLIGWKNLVILGVAGGAVVAYRLGLFRKLGRARL